ncbi:hypothetical protein P3X46_009683 [Hevea brasiliensis]|uniref:Transmembrane protein n=1 Tax=Hevea brasiliensis TaxID=3981 RepID=A0ABQ9MR35_HEVBR|nr:uncharacterized protein LOC110650026 [Hevea brasiliensis]XP_058003480.1 uncharacterized protein LOC110650026 [Hevea brasiliensis]XP_058003481.1 uncharacterized protein LOC110650026 [Hevea brasiliensis]XP_058003482.1 uncharacterized protein LOC110650026 [Hevea brasiliensis]KAJ9181565.1 hypothetical protein P3X46_009683 [Hevea brasiliensis]KAJ9181566.1 hypothetical protein P3X46_009683 [Hevea brasiliensis]
MTDQPRLSINNLRTTSHLIKQASASFSANLFTFLLLSLLLLSFRSLVESGTHVLTSFIDRDPSLRSLLSRLDLSGRHLHPHHRIQRFPPRRHRRPFLHLTRVGTLDDDFFSGDDDTDRSLFGPNRKLSPNGSSVILYNLDPGLGFSEYVVDNGIKISETVHSGIQFKVDSLLMNSSDRESTDYSDNEKEEEEEEEEENGSVGFEKGGDLDRIVDLQFFIKGLEMGRRDAAALFFLVSFLSAAYGWVILGFTAIYSWILGIIFVAVVNDLLGRFTSFVAVVWDGSRLGLKRLTGFILMRWAVRDALTQLIGLWYFGEIEDQYSFFKLFIRLKLMPFSIMSPWIRGFEKEISGFLFTWFLLDAFVAFIFAVDAWVTIVDSRRTGREIIKEGCYLISTLFNQAVQIKSMETILCGSAARWLLTRVFGKFLAAVFQSAVEVYFMVAWLIFYFAARCKEAHSEGRRFGRRELEGLIDGLG